MGNSRFYNKIKSATEERGVVDVYNEGISKYFQKEGTIIEYRYKCDGYVDYSSNLKLLIEYKYDEDLHNSVSRAKVLAQVLYYLKRFEESGEPLPSVVMVGDINEVFVMHTNPLLKYLNENIDWGIAASCVKMQNPELVSKIAADSEISPYVYDITDTFSFKDVADKIKEIAGNTIRKVRITEHNIAIIFDDFVKRVLKNSDKISPNDLVGIFINSIIDRENCYQHPGNENKLVCYKEQYDINGRYYRTFFSHFEKEYSPKEKNKFTEISDRLIEDTKRRRSGEFYTPTVFTDYAHRMLSKQFGDDWKEKYVVWDCCWGTGNLTRDYRFNELYASTLEQAELDCGQRYNPEATKFIFDFLNNEITQLAGLEKLPQGLANALKQDRKILFFLNPPYATTCNFGDTNKAEDGNDTLLNAIMKDAGNGRCSDNLYAQFLWHILSIKRKFNLSNIKIALFSPISFLASDSYANFRSQFLQDFNFLDGIQFKASNFAGVSDTWGISFSIWDDKECENKREFHYKLVDFVGGNLEVIGNKKVYNVTKEESASKWVREPINLYKTADAPQMTNAINYKKNKKGCRGNLIPNALGFLYNNSNNVEKNSVNVGLFTSCFSSGTGCSITKDNFERCISLFSCRKLISSSWINFKDEYILPNVNNEFWDNFVNNSIIYSLFNSASQQSSLRQIEYENKFWDIKNEFFFMSKNEIMNLANENHFDETYNDARVSEERFVYKKLQEIELSKEAQDVLDKAIELTKKSFQMRETFNIEHPEYQIMNWDCGWYQIKAVLKEYFPDDLKEFQELYKILADKMRPMVYELGFLK